MGNIHICERKRIASVGILRRYTPLYLCQWQDCGSVRSQASSTERHSRYHDSIHASAVDQRKTLRGVLRLRAETIPEKDSECCKAGPSALGPVSQVAQAFGEDDRLGLVLDRGRRRSFHFVVALAASETVFLASLPDLGFEIRLLAST